ncbi:MAG: hypothetical protein ACYC6W_11025 [Nitrosotalea sp.]
MTTTNAIDSPSLGGISAVNNAVLVTNGSGVGSFSTSIKVDNISSSALSAITLNNPAIVKELQNPVPFNLTITSLSASSGTITSIQLCGGIVVFTPSVAATWTLDTGSNIDTTLGVPNSSRGINIYFINQSDFPITINAGTGSNLTGMTVANNFIIPPRSSCVTELSKIDSTPTYALFGNSFNPGNTEISVTGTSKTIGLSDINTMQNCNNASTQTITIPLSTFPVSTRINFVQLGAGQVVFAPAGGVSFLNIVSSNSPKISAPNGVCTAEQISPNTWLIYGNITA